MNNYQHIVHHGDLGEHDERVVEYFVPVSELDSIL